MYNPWAYTWSVLKCLQCIIGQFQALLGIYFSSFPVWRILYNKAKGSIHFSAYVECKDLSIRFCGGTLMSEKIYWLTTQRNVVAIMVRSWNVSPLPVYLINFYGCTGTSRDEVKMCLDIMSDHNMKFAWHIQNLVMTDCYFQHCFWHNPDVHPLKAFSW